MDAKDFLKYRFEDIVDQIRTIKVSYEYWQYSDTHIIEVVPLEEFENNDLYQELEKDLYLEFNKRFFPSTLLISTENSLNRVSNPEWAICKEQFSYSYNISLSLDESSMDFNDNFKLPNSPLNHIEVVISDKGHSINSYAMAA